jgi:Flp pilus assembly protein TadG
MTARGGSRRGERGAVLVEAALVLPALMLFFLGIIDLGLWVFAGTQASGGARDGARAAILSYHQADVATSADAAAIRDAVVRRVGGQPSGTPLTVVVRCVGASDATPLAGGCGAASVLNRDRVDVTVSWERRPISFVTVAFGPSQTVTGRAVMVVQDRPPGALPAP